METKNKIKEILDIVQSLQDDHEAGIMQKHVGLYLITVDFIDNHVAWNTKIVGDLHLAQNIVMARELIKMGMLMTKNQLQHLNEADIIEIKKGVDAQIKDVFRGD